MEYAPSGEDFRQARERIKPYINQTPLLRAEGLELDGRRVYIKPENLQRTGSFKARGAFNALASLPPESRQRGVIAFSSGNHGAAIAFAAQEMGRMERGQGYPCTVVMPERASPVKTAKVKALGAEVVHCGTTVEDRHKKALEIAAATGREVIPSYDDPRIICGQGTLAGEIMDQWMGVPSRTRRLYMFAGPVGGGGLMGGIAAGLRARGFGGRIVGIEPEDANDTQQSLAKGERVSIPSPMTVCDGLRSTTPGQLTFPLLKKCLEGVVTVSDEEVLGAVSWLLSEVKLMVEPSGAVAVAAWLNGKLTNPDHDPESPEHAGDVVLVVSGGNVDPKVALNWIK
ncbi:MAG TPA: threonine/serine dehydratase [Planctomycetota bacterium]|nr:threonine/serine dehydratase [Planctomycetota bacterium]